jgi:hypothetical protein
MGSKLTLVLCCAAMAALTTPSQAQQARHAPSHAAPPPQHQQTGHTNDAGNAYGQAPFEDAASPRDHQPGQCFIVVDGDHDLGYWGSCSTKGARQVK